jgi:hypothetical protein
MICVRREWEKLKAIFLKKNPFEEPFFKMDGLRDSDQAATRVVRERPWQGLQGRTLRRYRSAAATVPELAGDP